MKRVLALLCLTSVTLFFSASAASATKPVKEFVPASDFVLDGICDFVVDVHIVVNRVYSKTFFDKDGNVVRQELSGVLVLDLINEDTGSTVRVNVPGPGTYTFEGDTTILAGTGPWLLFFFPGALEGHPEGLLWLTTGHFVLEFPSEGPLSFDDFPARTTDACALLAV